jgi:subtilisin-like proprotein convertase family protein
VISGVGNVSNLTVKIGNLTHTFDGDLLITLISPSGTRVVLSNRRGSSGDNFVNTVFDDTAATPIASGTPPFTGSFKPDGVLGTLNGQNANGTWALEINDLASGDSGTLSAWSITLGSTEPNQFSDVSGNYAYNGLSAGAYVIRQEPIAGQTLTQPASGSYNINALGGDIVTNANFGNSSAVARSSTATSSCSTASRCRRRRTG